MDFLYSIFPAAEAFASPRIYELVLLPEKQEAVLALNILKVDVSPDPAVWRITLRDKPTMPSLLDDLAQGLCAAYDLQEVIFEFSTESNTIVAFGRECLLRRIKEICPGSHFVLEKADWRLDSGLLTITVESAFALERLKQKQIDRLIADFFQNEFAGRIKTDFIASGLAAICGDAPADYPLPLPETATEQKTASAENRNRPKNKNSGKILYGNAFKGNPVSIAEINEVEAKIIIEGTMRNFGIRENRDGSLGVKFVVADNTDAIAAKILFKSKNEYEAAAREVREGIYARFCGKVMNDSYEQNELVLMPRSIIAVEKMERWDGAAQKRVELHAHTKMSAMDSVMATESYIKRAALWGHKAAAITDHGVAQAFPEAYAAAKKSGIKVIFGLEGYLIENWEEKSASWHIVILAATQKGLFNLYKLISLSHLQYYYKRPRIPRKVLEEYREGLIIGSACEAGELYQALVNRQPEDQVRRIAGFYDYLEIQPNGNNRFLIQKGKMADEEALCQLNRQIVALGKELGKPVVATCDVHFLEPEDSIYRSILQCGQDYENAAEQAPLFFRTTDEMLAEFAYLGVKDAYEVVVNNPLAIAEKIPMLNPIPDELYAPKLPGAVDEVLSVSYKNARRLYGENLPDIVEARLKLELDSIIGNGFSELYLIAHKLVEKSIKDGYPVCSRGSVGSSFVATMMNITEVNPLLPHYRCPRCFYSEFITDGSYGSGFDLPARKCPVCAADLTGDGHNIPFAVFLGFNGDKVPDIDLNFSGDYQAQAHKYTEELFGRSNVFRAGTISTVAEKTAAGFARKYYEEKSMPVRNARIDSLLHGCTGVKRTTGQHPGGIMVVPRDMDVHFFTPVQRPADKTASNVITTHFDYHSISDRLVKLDILGHDDPTIIKMLEETTGIAAKTIPFDDPEALSLFSSTSALGVTPQELGAAVGTFGIPEFGTRFVRQMLETLQPKSFNELVRISGYSHGEMVWLKNAEELIKNGTARTSETIATRDDIMNFLMEKGIDPLISFKIMEDVRKGNKNNLAAEYQSLLLEKKVPEWYVASCKKISYLFPKAHAAAYVMTACRIAYWKVHYPREFYAAYFSVRAEDFDSGIILAGRQAIKDALKQIEKKGQNATAKEKKLLVVLEIAFEMYLRGIEFQRVNIYNSHPTQFLIAGKDILLPLTALNGLGESLAVKIAQARKTGLFSSKDDLRIRSGISKATIDVLSAHGCLNNMPESNQINLF